METEKENSQGTQTMRTCYWNQLEESSLSGQLTLKRGSVCSSRKTQGDAGDHRWKQPSLSEDELGGPKGINQWSREQDQHLQCKCDYPSPRAPSRKQRQRPAVRVRPVGAECFSSLHSCLCSFGGCNQLKTLRLWGTNPQEANS